VKGTAASRRARCRGRWGDALPGRSFITQPQRAG